jgi:hypothetical protein
MMNASLEELQTGRVITGEARFWRGQLKFTLKECGSGKRTG